jgi:hypothetical protein
MLISVSEKVCHPCNQERPMLILQNHKSQKRKNHQVKNLIKPYHQEEKREEPYH